MIRFVELALAAFAVVILTGTNGYYFLLGVPAEITDEELLAYGGNIQNVFFLAYLIVAALCVLHWQKMILGMAAVWPIVLLVVMAWLSNLWTVAPDITFQRCISLTVTTLMGIYLFARFDLKELLRLLTAIVAILAIGCLAWVALVPDYGIHTDNTHAGAWRGIFFHKNTAGRVMVFGLAVIMAAWVGGGINRGLLAIVAALALVVAIGTTSQTALLGLLILGGGLVVVRMVRGQVMKSAIITLFALTLAWHGALLVLASHEVILEALGRDPSLTGRTEIWAYCLRFGLERPLTGWGYDAFWNGDFSPGALFAVYWDAPHSHNGWLEVFLALGLPGLLIMIGIMIVTLFRAVVLARYHPSTAPGILVILSCFSILTVSVSEPVFLERHTFEWILVVVVVGCARAMTWSLEARPENEMAQPESAYAVQGQR